MFRIEQCRIARTNRTKLWAETSEQAECEQAECIVYIVYQIWTSWIPNLHQSSTSALATEMNSIPCVKPIALHQTLYIMINLNAVGHLSQMAKLTLFKVCVEYYFMEGDWNINLNSTPKQWIVQISRYLPKNLPQNFGNQVYHPIEALRQWRALWQLSLLAIKLFGFSENNLGRPNFLKKRNNLTRPNFLKKDKILADQIFSK